MERQSDSIQDLLTSVIISGYQNLKWWYKKWIFDVISDYH